MRTLTCLPLIVHTKCIRINLKASGECQFESYYNALIYDVHAMILATNFELFFQNLLEFRVEHNVRKFLHRDGRLWYSRVPDVVVALFRVRGIETGAF